MQAHAVAGSGCGDDICRITSPDCLGHVGQPDWASTGFCDGLQLSQLTGILGSGQRPVQEPAPSESDSEPSPGRDPSDQYTQGSLGLEGSRSATEHSTETHRTGPAPLSSAHAKSCGQTPEGIGRTGPELSGQTSHRCDSAGCKIEGCTTDASSEQGTAADNAHMLGSASFCSYCAFYQKVRLETNYVATFPTNLWPIPTQGRPDAHFATFPDELPRRCILAGTSERGVCAECRRALGAGNWRRITDEYRQLHCQAVVRLSATMVRRQSMPMGLVIRRDYPGQARFRPQAGGPPATTTVHIARRFGRTRTQQRRMRKR